MRFFTCIVGPLNGAPPDDPSRIAEPIRRGCETFLHHRQLEFRWDFFDRMAVLTGWDDPWGHPMVATCGSNVAVGMVRLDNADELRRILDDCEKDMTDLELVLHFVVKTGSTQVSRLIGDFCFVVWRPGCQILVAACDPFLVRRLYYSTEEGRLVFSSRGEVIGASKAYNEEYLAEVVGCCDVSPGISVFDGVKALPAGTMAVATAGTGLSLDAYWSVHDIINQPMLAVTAAEAAEMCRGLLAEAVKLRIDTNYSTWAHLSGGIDSSSIVSMAEWLKRAGGESRVLPPPRPP
jgi:asparagine synthase (glutamine-hydrolysing)